MHPKIKSAITEVMSATTPRERIDQFLALDFPGVRGVAELRERQARVRERLAEPRPVGWSRYVPRAERWSRYERATRRAKSEGLISAAKQIAEAYDSNIETVYRSDKAHIVWASSCVEIEDHDYYAKSYGHPARWVNGGVWIDFESHLLSITTYRGKKINIPLPRQIRSKNLVGGLDRDSGALLDGDYFGLRARRRDGTDWVTRYTLNQRTGKYRVSGYAARVDGRWEHGDSRADIELELAHKRAVADQQAREQALREKYARKSRLIARLCSRLVCTVVDARAAGYCKTGIRSFLSRHLSREVTSMTAAQLRATGDNRVDKVIYQAAFRVASQAQ